MREEGKEKGKGRGKAGERERGRTGMKEKLLRVKERCPMWACLGSTLLVVYKVLS